MTERDLTAEEIAELAAALEEAALEDPHNADEIRLESWRSVIAMARRAVERSEHDAQWAVWLANRYNVAELERQLADAKGLIDELLKALDQADEAEPHHHPLNPQERAGQWLRFRALRAALDAPPQSKDKQ